jgi:hypothetical protein
LTEIVQHIPPLGSVQVTKETGHVEAVQESNPPEASFIAAQIPLLQVDDSELQVEPELMTAYAPPDCVAASRVICKNIPDPKSVTPIVNVKKIGAKIAASTAAVPVEHLKRRQSILIMTLTDRDTDWRL